MFYVTKDKNMGRKEEIEKQKKERLGLEKYNKQGCLMKIIEYHNYENVVVEFQDKYKAHVKTSWKYFNNSGLTNPYYPTICGVGIVGNKYPIFKNNKHTKEYQAWHNMINRCFYEKIKEEHPTYKNVTCSEEWLLFENFYEWLHLQENFDKWYNEDKWCLDKDILVKGNKIYSPNTCCLVPQNVNTLFTKKNANRGKLPIGVFYYAKLKRYQAIIIYGKNNNRSKRTSEYYPTPEDAFYLGYKPAKEAYIKRVAKEEYAVGNITEKCYNAMMNYEVEITD